ncbi:unnamed protein product [Triticum turgidum subsp. durum]|uniref:Uncharacterized protein n=1 Tax=Triticum turgidum subsp. durum TaxID=4567 RepID=A0A9R1NVG6_TRITD|nr:unnamed protein product [Triticum turgidum subsp. durum]
MPSSQTNRGIRHQYQACITWTCLLFFCIVLLLGINHGIAMHVCGCTKEKVPITSLCSSRQKQCYASHPSSHLTVEITCRGRPLLPFMTLQHVRDSIWCQRDAVSTSVAPDTSTANHIMVLQYGRRP